MISWQKTTFDKYFNEHLKCHLNEHHKYQHIGLSSLLRSDSDLMTITDHCRRRHFQMHFLKWRILNYEQKFTEDCSEGSIWHWSQFRWWLGAKRSINHYPNQYWPSSLRLYGLTRHHRVNGKIHIYNITKKKCLPIQARIPKNIFCHYNDVIMGAIASQITSFMIVYSTVYSGADQRKHQSSASLACVRVIHRWPVNSPHKGPITRKTFPFGDVIIL